MGSEPPSLWSHCSSSNHLCPKLMPATKIYADLRWSTTPFTARSLVYKFGCLQGSGSSAERVCHVVAQLSTWNEALDFINVELREGPPGQLSLLCLHIFHGSSGVEARERHATILVHWLLTVHRCDISVLDKQSVALLASIVANSETIWHFEYEAYCVASCRLLLIYLAKGLPSNTALASLEVIEHHAVVKHSTAVKDFVRRNAALIDCAAHFILGTKDKHFAKAFERVASGRGIVTRVQELAA